MRLARAFAAAHLLRKGKMRLEASESSEPLWSAERGKKVAENRLFCSSRCPGGDQNMHQRLLEALHLLHSIFHMT